MRINVALNILFLLGTFSIRPALADTFDPSITDSTRGLDSSTLKPAPTQTESIEKVGPDMTDTNATPDKSHNTGTPPTPATDMGSKTPSSGSTPTGSTGSGW